MPRHPGSAGGSCAIAQGGCTCREHGAAGAAAAQATVLRSAHRAQPLHPPEAPESRGQAAGKAGGAERGLGWALSGGTGSGLGSAGVGMRIRGAAWKLSPSSAAPGAVLRQLV